MKVLIAEDSPTVRAAVAKVLTDAGHDVVLAADGVETVTQFFTEYPDLVVNE